MFGAAERNRETDARIQQQVIVGDVRHAPVEAGHVDSSPAGNRLRETRFEEVSVRGRNRQARRLRAKALEFVGARDQQVLDRRRLKCPIVRSAEHEILRRPRPGDSKARAEGLVIDNEAVVIPPQPGIDGPRTAADLVLHEQRLLAIVTPIRKGEVQRHVGIEVVAVGDRVGEVLAHRPHIHIRAGLPLVHAAMPGERSVQVELTKAPILRGGNRCRLRIGPELRGDIAHHASNVADHAGGKDSLKRKLRGVLQAVAILTLPGFLLDILVRHQELRRARGEG